MSTTLTIRTLLSALDRMTPFALAESWDNVGLMVGAPDQAVNGLLVGLDPTETLLDEAIALGCNTLLTHHPLFFKPVKNLRTDQPLGRFLAKALASGINVIACHTNLDVVTDGVSDILAQRLGLNHCQPLTTMPAVAGETPLGFGRIGNLAQPLPATAFLATLPKALHCQAFSVAGPLPPTVSRIAVCGGSGSDLAERAQELGAEAYITAEVKHSVARWAEMASLCIIDAGHFATENIVIKAFADRVATALDSSGHATPVRVTSKQQGPFAFYCTAKGCNSLSDIDSP